MHGSSISVMEQKSVWNLTWLVSCWHNAQVLWPLKERLRRPRVWQCPKQSLPFKCLALSILHKLWPALVHIMLVTPLQGRGYYFLLSLWHPGQGKSRANPGGELGWGGGWQSKRCMQRSAEPGQGLIGGGAEEPRTLLEGQKGHKSRPAMYIHKQQSHRFLARGICVPWERKCCWCYLFLFMAWWDSQACPCFHHLSLLLRNRVTTVSFARDHPRKCPSFSTESPVSLNTSQSGGNLDSRLAQ